MTITFSQRALASELDAAFMNAANFSEDMRGKNFVKPNVLKLAAGHESTKLEIHSFRAHLTRLDKVWIVYCRRSEISMSLKPAVC